MRLGAGAILTLSAMCLACTTSKVATTTDTNSERQVASGAASEPGCEVPSSLTGEAKQNLFLDYQRRSINEVATQSKSPAISSVTVDGVTQGQDGANEKYVREAFYPQHRLGFATEAVQATVKFLVPAVNDSVGYKSLRTTFSRKCELFEEPAAKKVHALGSLATARMVVYPKLKTLDANDKVTGETANPFTGLLQPQGNENGIPLLLRVSVANPVAETIEVGNKSLLLEFIPGLGLKFLIDGQRSVDLVAMESLAGQGSDQNYFKYEFSPDFSKHAPSGFNTAEGAEKKQMMDRYDRNAVNHYVMNLVGKRFFQVIPDVTGIPLDKIDPHSNAGPHPFVISIQSLAQTDSKGHAVEPAAQKRPWRLVFKPALDNLPAARKAAVTSSAPYKPGKVETDFRYKLTSLKPNDRMYYVIAETEAKKRFILGEIVLTSALTPSPFADKLYFVQHQLDLRKTTFANSIVNP
ncbi:MAG: hypothetical protein JSU04_18545 [Bdellovibrionales bacterium]|nr:hypothetical protein [Bdellovibrionales bacterium]